MHLVIRPARRPDLPRLWPVIERAYRGEAARTGWTHEADLIEGDRTSLASLEAIVDDLSNTLLMAVDGEEPIGCVHVADRGDGTSYLGLLCVGPEWQRYGVGKRLIASAEAWAQIGFHAERIEMTVIESRTELIAFYERRGYAQTGEKRPFPIALDPPLFLTVLARTLPSL
jgi:ribosomal protein S18 acetylase RimI-like enzyme